MSHSAREIKYLLVTGGCGFIGANFIRYLLDESDFSGTVINVDKLTYAGNRENLLDIEERFPERYVFVQGDICDQRQMEQLFTAYPVDGICHFAAESHVDRSIRWPDTFIRTNIVGSFTLLELARIHMERMVLFHHISTDEVFGSLGADGYFSEESPYQPSSPYSASKAASDHLVRAYHKTYGLPVTISNCSNNYGPYQFPEKLIPLMILNAVEGASLPVYGDGGNVRDWLYVRDHCTAIWSVMTKGSLGETYVVGGGTEMRNIELVHLICDLLDAREKRGNRSKRDLITFVPDRPGHDYRYAIDPNKIRDQLGWSPAETLASGIEKTIDWYCENRGWVNRVRSGEYRRWISTHYG